MGIVSVQHRWRHNRHLVPSRSCPSPPATFLCLKHLASQEVSRRRAQRCTTLGQQVGRRGHNRCKFPSGRSRRRPIPCGRRWAPPNLHSCDPDVTERYTKFRCHKRLSSPVRPDPRSTTRESAWGRSAPCPTPRELLPTSSSQPG